VAAPLLWNSIREAKFLSRYPLQRLTKSTNRKLHRFCQHGGRLLDSLVVLAGSEKESTLKTSKLLAGL